MKKYISTMTLIVFCSLGILIFPILVYAETPVSDLSTEQGQAVALDIELNCEQTPDLSRLLDHSMNTKTSLSSNVTLTITSDQPMSGIYIIWDKPCSEWTLDYNGVKTTMGTHGYLHEYVSLPEPATCCSITPSREEAICEIQAFSAGTLPDDVEVWEPPCEQADILVFSTHADDEILFLGGVLATYAGEQKLNVQVVYLTNYWNSTRIREHEKLDGLWASGVHNYPVNGTFDDLYSKSLEQAMQTYHYEEILKFIIDEIRQFQPLICVTQDTNGEYGHGGHQILAKAVMEATTQSMNVDICPESANKYGVWDVPKTYLHLYPEHKIHMNLRLPLNHMGGRTTLDVATAAYKKHVSQQWCWFYVSDEYEYSCADFGLYRSTVGYDSANEMTEHIKTYGQQKAEQELQTHARNVTIDLSTAGDHIASIGHETALQAHDKEVRRTRNCILSISILGGILIIFVGFTFLSHRKGADIKNLFLKFKHHLLHIYHLHCANHMHH